MFNKFFRNLDLFDYIKKGNVKKVKEKLTQNNLNERNIEGHSPIEAAILSAQLDIVKLLVDKGCRIPVQINDVSTIHKLIQEGCKNYPLVKYIINNNQNVDEFCNGITALAECMKQKTTDFNMVATLLELGADINSASEYWLTPLVVLIKNNNKRNDEKIEALKYFEQNHIEFIAKQHPFFFSERRENLYVYVLQRKEYELFVQLLRVLKNITSEEMSDIKPYINVSNFKGIDLHNLLSTINELSLSVYLPASCYHQDELLIQLETRKIEDIQNENFLLELCINPNIAFEDKKRLIQNYKNIGGKLTGSKYFGKNNEHRFNLLGYLACFDKNNDNLKLIDFLIEIGSSIEDSGESALFASLWFAKFEYVEFFLEKGANLDFVTEKGDAIFTRVGSATLQGAYTSFKDCFKLMEMVFSSIYAPDRRRSLMKKSYKFAHKHDEPFEDTNPFHFFTYLYKTSIEMQVLEYFLGNGFDINTEIHHDDLTFNIPKCIFSSSNSLFAIEVLNRYPNINYQDSSGRPHAWWAILKSDKDYILIEMLINKINDINQAFIVSGKNMTLLEHSMACVGSNERVTNLILDCHPDIDVDLWRGEPIIVHAFKNKYSVDTLNKIIKKQKNIDAKFSCERFTNCKPTILTPLAFVCTCIQGFYTSATKLSEDETYLYRLKIAKLLIDSGADVNYKCINERIENKYAPGVEKDEDSILEMAFFVDNKNKSTALVELLLKSNVELTTITGAFNSRIEHYLTLWGHFTDEQCIEYFELLKKYRPEQIDLNVKTNTGANTVLAAVQHCKHKLVQWLIDNGADPFLTGGHDNSNAIDRALSIWPEYAPVDRADTIKVLLNAGLDIDIKNPEGQTPLMTAADVGALDAVKLLLDNGANAHELTARGENAMTFAVTGANDFQFTRKREMNESNKIRIINQLNEYGVNINCVPLDGLTSLGYSIWYGHREIFEHLVKLGANINLKDCYGKTPLMRAMMYDNLDAKRTLLSNDNIDLLAVDESGENILFYLARQLDSSESASELEKFINQFKVPYVKNNFGESPLFYSAYGSSNMTKLILNLDINHNLNAECVKGATPLLIACGFYKEESEIEGFNFNIQKEIIEQLIDKGADINFKNRNGITALDVAKRQRCDGLVELLIFLGANQENEIKFH